MAYKSITAEENIALAKERISNGSGAENTNSLISDYTGRTTRGVDNKTKSTASTLNYTEVVDTADDTINSVSAEQTKSEDNIFAWIGKYFTAPIDLTLSVFEGLTSAIEGTFDALATAGYWIAKPFMGMAGVNLAETDKDFSKFIETDFLNDVIGYYDNDVIKSIKDFSMLDDIGIVGDISRGLAENLGQMAPVILLGQGGAMLGGTAAKGLQLVGQTEFFLSATGGGIQEALRDGAELTQASVYGVLSGVVEEITEAIGGILPNALGGSSVIQKAIGRVAGSAAGRKAVSYIVGMVGEGFEEMLADVINPVLKRIYDENALDEYADPEYYENMLYDGLIGALMGGVLGASELNDTNQVKEISEEISNNLNKLSRARANGNVELADRIQSEIEKQSGILAEYGNKYKDSTISKITEEDRAAMLSIADKYALKDEKGNYSARNDLSRSMSTSGSVTNADVENYVTAKGNKLYEGTFEKSERKARQTIEKIAKKTESKVAIVEDIKTYENTDLGRVYRDSKGTVVGYHIPGSDVTVISKYAFAKDAVIDLEFVETDGSRTKKSINAAIGTMMHEITHFLETTKSGINGDKKQYNAAHGALAKSVYDLMNSTAFERIFRSWVSSVADTYGNTFSYADYENAIKKMASNEELTKAESKAYEEITANVVEQMALQDARFIEMVCTEESDGLGKKILGGIQRFIKSLGETEEQRKVHEVLKGIEKKYQEAIAAKLRLEEMERLYGSDVIDTDADAEYSIVSMLEASGFNVTLNEKNKSIEKIERDGKTYTDKDILDGKVSVTPEEIADSATGAFIRESMESLAKNGKIKESEVQKQIDARIKFVADFANIMLKYRRLDGRMVYEITGALAFSSVKDNSDAQYSFSIDFATICAKTESILAEISKKMQEVKRGLTKDEVLEIYTETAKKGMPVPCSYCYVFAKWLGMGSAINKTMRMVDIFKGFKDKKERHAFAIKTTAEVDEYIERYKETTGNQKLTKSKAREALVEALNKAYTEIESITYDSALSGKENKEKYDSDVANVLETLKEETGMDFLGNIEEALYGMHGLNGTEKDLSKKSLLNAIDTIAAYGWLTKVENKNDANVVTEENMDRFRELLFDLNRTDEFATEFPEIWTWRKSLGAGYGKSVMPYAPAILGNVIYGVAYKSSRELARKTNDFMDLTKDKKWSKNAEKAYDKAKEAARKQKLIGGIRVQSWSDFKESFLTDWLITALELESIEAAVQGYSKVFAGVETFSALGFCINQSLSARVTTNEKGERVLEFSVLNGMDVEGAIDIMKRYSQAGTIVIGFNDEQLELCLADKNVRMIIPYHASGNKAEVLSAMLNALAEDYDSVDYAAYQNDKELDAKDLEKGVVVIKKKAYDATQNIMEPLFALDYVYDGTENGTTGEALRELYAKNKHSACLKMEKHFKKVRSLRFSIIQGKRSGFSEQESRIIAENKYLQGLIKTFTEGEYAGVKLAKDPAEKIFPYEYWDKSVDYDGSNVNSENFVEYTASLGIMPRFYFIKDNAFYWKTLVDRNMYDYNTGKYVEQPTVSLTNILTQETPAEAFKAMAKKSTTADNKVVITQECAAAQRRPKESLWKVHKGGESFSNKYHRISEAEPQESRRRGERKQQTIVARDQSDPIVVKETRMNGRAVERYEDITEDVLADEVAHELFDTTALPDEIYDSVPFKKINEYAIRQFKHYGSILLPRLSRDLKRAGLGEELKAVNEMAKAFPKAKMNEPVFIEERLFGDFDIRGNNRKKFRNSSQYKALSEEYQKFATLNGKDAMNVKKFKEYLESQKHPLYTLFPNDEKATKLEYIENAERTLRKITADSFARSTLREILGAGNTEAEVFARKTEAYNLLFENVRSDYMYGRDVSLKQLKATNSGLIKEIRTFASTYNAIKEASNADNYKKMVSRVYEYGISEGDLARFGFEQKLKTLVALMVGKNGLITPVITKTKEGELKTRLTPNFTVNRMDAFADAFRAFYNESNPALFGSTSNGGMVSKVITNLFVTNGVYDYVSGLYKHLSSIINDVAAYWELDTYDKNESYEDWKKRRAKAKEKLYDAVSGMITFSSVYADSETVSVPNIVKAINTITKRINHENVSREELELLDDNQKKITTKKELDDYLTDWLKYGGRSALQPLVSESYTKLLTLCRTAMNEIVRKVGKYDTVLVNGKITTVNKEVNKERDIYKRRRAAFKKVKGIIKSQALQWVDPELVFRMADMYDDKGAFSKLFEDIQGGELNAHLMRFELEDIYNKFAKAKGNREFIKSLSDEKRTITVFGKIGNGERDIAVKLTKAEILSLYLTIRQEDGLNHVTRSGITFFRGNERLNDEPFVLKRQYEKDEAGEIVTDEFGNPIDVTLENFAKDYLGADEQGNLTGKIAEYVESIDNVMNAAGNRKGEIDTYFYGVPRLLDNFYPLSSDADAFGNKVYTSYSEAFKDLVEEFSIVQQRTGGASPLVIRSAEDVMRNYIYKISTYCGLAIPLDSFSQIMNRRDDFRGGEYARTLMGYAKADVWEGIDKYITDVLMAVQGARSERRGLLAENIEKFRARFSRYVLGLNLSSALKQWAAFPMASLYLRMGSIKYGLAHALPTVFSKREREIMFKYSGAAKMRFENHDIVKAQGVIEATDTHASKLTMPLESMDFSIINYAWQAAKYQCGATEEQTRGLSAVEKETRLKKAGELLDKIIFSTQANSMVTSKTAWQRGNTITKALSMFTADAPKQFSRIIESFGRWLTNRRLALAAENETTSAEYMAVAKEGASDFMKASTATLLSAVTVALAAYAIRLALDKDDDDENALAVMGEEFFSNLLGVIPVGDEIVTLATRALTRNKNYELSLFAFDAVNELVDIAGNLFSLSTSIAGGKDFTEKQVGKAVRDAIFILGQVTGIPTRNIYNIINGSLQFTPSAQYSFQNLFGGGNYGADLRSALEKGDTALAETIVDAMYMNYGLALENRQRGELLRLYNLGYDVLPKSVSSSVMIDGEKYEMTRGQRDRFKKIYAGADEDMKSVLTSNLGSDAAKAKAIRFIYDYYYDLAKYDLSGYNEEDTSRKYVFGQSVNISDMAKAYAVHSLAEAEKDRKGNAIQGSKRRIVSQYVQKLNLKAAQKYLIMAFLGYSVDKPSLVKSYVSGLKISQTLKKALLAYCGISA